MMTRGLRCWDYDLTDQNEIQRNVERRRCVDASMRRNIETSVVWLDTYTCADCSIPRQSWWSSALLGNAGMRGLDSSVPTSMQLARSLGRYIGGPLTCMADYTAILFLDEVRHNVSDRMTMVGVKSQGQSTIEARYPRQSWRSRGKHHMHHGHGHVRTAAPLLATRFAPILGALLAAIYPKANKRSNRGSSPDSRPGVRWPGCRVRGSTVRHSLSGAITRGGGLPGRSRGV